MSHQIAATLLIIGFGAVAMAGEDDDLVIDNFQFTWAVAEIGKTQFLIEKDEKTTKAGLRLKSGGVPGPKAISMTLEDAEGVGRTLARTDEFAEKMKGTTDQIERIKTGTMLVEFRTTGDGEFRVQVTPQKWMHVFATLKPAEAKALAGPMRKAVLAGALVDRKIKF